MVYATDGSKWSFYESSEIRRTEGGTLWVWTMDLLDSTVTERALLDDSVTRRSASKYLAGYVPPLLKLYPQGKHTSDDERAFEVKAAIVAEEVAATSTILPLRRVLVELNCSKRKYRVLTMSTETGEDLSPGSWEQIDPETTASNLLTLACSGTGERG
jgi:hypothetical protein